MYQDCYQKLRLLTEVCLQCEAGGSLIICCIFKAYFHYLMFITACQKTFETKNSGRGD